MRNESARTNASRRSSLAPATVCRSRKRSSCLGLSEKTCRPRSSNVSTMAPRGTSMATAMRPGSADQSRELVGQGGEAYAGVRDAALGDKLPLGVQHAHHVRFASPIHPHEELVFRLSHTRLLARCQPRRGAMSSLYWRSRRNSPPDVHHDFLAGAQSTGGALGTGLHGHSQRGGRTRAWYRVFPATPFYFHHETRQRRRHHLHETVIQRAVKVGRAPRGHSSSTHHATHFATRLRPTCWRTATTSGRCKNYWATATSARR